MSCECSPVYKYLEDFSSLKICTNFRHGNRLHHTIVDMHLGLKLLTTKPYNVTFKHNKFQAGMCCQFHAI